jgi:hypothetical protein
MSFSPSIIATLATGKAIQDLRLLLSSLAIFNANPPTVYVYCDSTIASISDFKYPGKLVFKPVLDEYTRYNRQQMEAAPGKHFKNLWFDFMTEKINLIRWVFREEPAAEKDGVMFCDADICFTGPLPAIPRDAILALSPHAIRAGDAKKYGYYNGGYLWMLQPRLADVWWDACATARFYEQSALEDLAASVTSEELYAFPVTENYGWWRLWQGAEDPGKLMGRWGIKAVSGVSAIVIDGAALGSVHTHFFEKHDMATRAFNEFVTKYLTHLSKTCEPARRLLDAIKLNGNGPV